MERDINVDRRAVLVLCLPKLKATISDVLWTQPHCIFPAAACIDEEVESQACLAPAWMPFSVLRDFLGRPGVVTGRYVLDLADTPSWIARRDVRPCLTPPSEQGLQRLQPLVRSTGLISALVAAEHSNVALLHERYRFVPLLLAHGIQCSPAP
jgi:hypothetical protein